MKHPIAVAFAIALAISLVLAWLVVALHRAEETPWALALVMVGFPFIWFFAWLITNGIAWWRDTTGGGGARAGEEQRD